MFNCTNAAENEQKRQCVVLLPVSRNWPASGTFDVEASVLLLSVWGETIMLVWVKNCGM